MRVLDSHLHLWDPELLHYTWLEGPLAWLFGATEIEHARVARASTESAVFVQAETVEDAIRRARELAAAHPALDLAALAGRIQRRLDRRSRLTPGLWNDGDAADD